MAWAIKGRKTTYTRAKRQSQTTSTTRMPAKSSKLLSTITAARIRRAVARWAESGSEPDRPAVSVSIGVTEIASRLDTLRTVMRLADEALYEAKSHGKCRVVIRPRSDRSGPVAAADGAR